MIKTATTNMGMIVKVMMNMATISMVTIQRVTTRMATMNTAIREMIARTKVTLVVCYLI